MNELEMKHQFEAALLAAGRPLTTQQLSELFDERERPSLEQVLTALNALHEDYQSRGIELVEVSSGWRIQIRSNCIDFVSRLWQERPARYSRALLETLALIAYRQPITRGEIEEIRGVAVSSTIMRTLHDRNWIRVVGHREVPGRPELLATNRDFNTGEVAPVSNADAAEVQEIEASAEANPEAVAEVTDAPASAESEDVASESVADADAADAEVTAQAQ